MGPNCCQLRHRRHLGGFLVPEDIRCAVRQFKDRGVASSAHIRVFRGEERDMHARSHEIFIAATHREEAPMKYSPSSRAPREPVSSLLFYEADHKSIIVYPRIVVHAVCGTCLVFFSFHLQRTNTHTRPSVRRCPSSIPYVFWKLIVALSLLALSSLSFSIR